LYWFRKWTETNAKQILFRLFSVWTEIFFIRFVDTLVWTMLAVGKMIDSHQTSHQREQISIRLPFF